MTAFCFYCLFLFVVCFCLIRRRRGDDEDEEGARRCCEKAQRGSVFELFVRRQRQRRRRGGRGGREGRRGRARKDGRKRRRNRRGDGCRCRRASQAKQKKESCCCCWWCCCRRRTRPQARQATLLGSCTPRLIALIVDVCVIFRFYRHTSHRNLSRYFCETSILTTENTINDDELSMGS